MNSITNLSDQFSLLLMMNKSFQEILTPGCEFESHSGKVFEQSVLRWKCLGIIRSQMEMSWYRLQLFILNLFL
jgi:replicative superfamily II helicase